MNEFWKPIKDNVPPVGKQMIVTVLEHITGNKKVLFPVYYLEKPYRTGYAFFFKNLNDELLPDYHEVIAWATPTPYESEAE